MQALHAGNFLVSNNSQSANRISASCVQQSKTCQTTQSQRFRAFTSSPHAQALTKMARPARMQISAAAAKVDSQEHLQLATARLPKYVSLCRDDCCGWTANLSRFGPTSDPPVIHVRAKQEPGHDWICEQLVSMGCNFDQQWAEHAFCASYQS